MHFFSKSAGAILVSLILPLCVFGEDFMNEPLEQMTVQQLSASAWTDHVLAFEEVFKVIKVDSMLEFGLGRSTKIFLDRVPSVASLELASDFTLNRSMSWYQQCVKKFMPVYPNWKPSFRLCTAEVGALSKKALQSSPLLDPLTLAYFKEIADACTQGLSLLNGECTLAFVDSGEYGRGDLVNELFSRKVPIVAAHDTIETGIGGQYYGYDRVNPPKEYVAITFPARRLITFWIRQDVYGDEIINKLIFAAKCMESLA
jgi:hypothetical protein